MELWPWSSYNSILSSDKTMVLREELIRKFGNKENFMKYHARPIYPKGLIALE